MIDLNANLSHNFKGVAVKRLKVKSQLNLKIFLKANSLWMATGRTFKFMEEMHLNEGKKNIHSNHLHVT